MVVAVVIFFCLDLADKGGWLSFPVVKVDIILFFPHATRNLLLSDWRQVAVELQEVVVPAMAVPSVVCVIRLHVHLVNDVALVEEPRRGA